MSRTWPPNGTTATTPAGDPVCPGDAEGQAVYILDKILAALDALGARAEDVVRTRIYLRDPDQNGIELTWDRPRANWPREADGQLKMVTEPLDLDGLLAELDSAPVTHPT